MIPECLPAGGRPERGTGPKEVDLSPVPFLPHPIKESKLTAFHLVTFEFFPPFHFLQTPPAS